MCSTVLITTKDRKEDLRRAVQSAVDQTANPEVLVIDDGSSDGTAEMMTQEFPEVRLHREEESAGLIVRRNQGARLANGEIIFSIDDDAEFSSPEVVEQTLQEFDDPRIGAVAMPYVDVNRSPEVRQKSPEDEGRYCVFTFRGTAHALRRDLFLELGGYREHFIHQGEEMDYCVRMLDAGYVVRLGRSDIIKHYESPKRSYERMDFYGRRNDVLFGWHNVPSSELPLYFLLSIINTLRTAVDIGRFRNLFLGMLAGFRDCLRYSDVRHPVAAETYRLYRDLQRGGPRRLDDIEESLGDTSSASSMGYTDEEDLEPSRTSISREGDSMSDFQNEGAEMGDIERILDEVGDPILVVTHPRSGTHLTLDLLRKQFESCKADLAFGETLHHLYVDLDRLQASHPHPMSLSEAADLLGRAPRPTVKTHSLPSLPEHSGKKRELAQALIEQGDLLYVVRDGRDALCSTHVWKKEDEPELADYNLPEFLRLEKQGRTRVRYWAEHVRRWTRRPDTYVLQFEDILERPEEVVEHLGDELCLDPLYARPLLPEQVEGGRWTFYWRRLTRNFESTAINGRPNGEVPADWREAFSEEDRRLFQEQAGEVLRDFGYVTDESWLAASQ